MLVAARTSRFFSQEMTMATLRVKARTKPADGIVKQDRATLSGDGPAWEKIAVQKAADQVPASCNSLREYLKTNH
jgi:hypothetical protein